MNMKEILLSILATGSEAVLLAGESQATTTLPSECGTAGRCCAGDRRGRRSVEATGRRSWTEENRPEGSLSFNSRHCAVLKPSLILRSVTSSSLPESSLKSTLEGTYFLPGRSQSKGRKWFFGPVYHRIGGSAKLFSSENTCLRSSHDPMLSPRLGQGLTFLRRRSDTRAEQQHSRPWSRDPS